MSKRKRNFFSYFVLLMFTWQLGLLCTVSFFEGNQIMKQLSSLSEDSEDDDDSDTEESEIELFQPLHENDNFNTTFSYNFNQLNSPKFNSFNELAKNQVDFKVPFSPPEMI